CLRVGCPYLPTTRVLLQTRRPARATRVYTVSCIALPACMDRLPVSDDSLRRQRPFMQFWGARLCSGFGFQMLSVAVGWQIYAMTGRALDLGLVGLVQFVPSLLLALPAGHVADQFRRKRIVVMAQRLEWAAVVVLSLGSVFGWLNEWGILGLVFLVSVAKACESPARQAMVPGLVPERILARAM